MNDFKTQTLQTRFYYTQWQVTPKYGFCSDSENIDTLEGENFDIVGR